MARGLLLLAAALTLALVWTAVADRRQRADLLRADPDTLLMTPALRTVALRRGAEVFHDHCSSCHGGRGQGNPAQGVPDLRDHDWLYGSGLVSEIQKATLYGIRSGQSKGWHLASMPAYASARPYDAEPLPPLSPREIGDVVQLLRSYQGEHADQAAVTRGGQVWQKAGCWDCHGGEGRGDTAVGAPNLRDRITLLGGSEAALTRAVSQGHAGVSPAFAGRLDPFDVLAVSAYAASLSQPEGAGR